MTITYITAGNILREECLVAVPVNTVGRPGAGLALQWAKQFPTAAMRYMELCKDGALQGGSVWFVCDDFQLRSFAVVATKEHWRDPSRIEWIETGLASLSRKVSETCANGVPLKEIAVPALGCGLGGLTWDQVKSLIEKYLGDALPISVRVYPPRIK